MVRIDQSAFNTSGGLTVPDQKRESDKRFGLKGTHEKSFNWNDSTDGLWDKILNNDLN